MKEAQNPDEMLHTALSNVGEEPIIDAGTLEVKEKTKLAPAEKTEEDASPDFRPLWKNIPAQVTIITGLNGGKTSKGTFDDFVAHFRNRYEKISKMLANRGQLSLTSVENLKKHRGEKVKIIVMVTEKRTTKNGHVFISAEDPTGVASVLVPSSNRELVSFCEKIMPDEIIAIEGSQKSELFIAESIHQPDIPLKEVKTTEDDIGIVMISDIHVGSRLFMKKNFEQFIEWINGKRGNEKQREIAAKVKYVCMAGDLVDGIGIYPKQEEELLITDIFEQYKTFTEYVKQIPPHIQVIISPGNHDAVKTSDPQPPLPRELVPELYETKNVTLVSSPALVNVHGLKVLIYHGTCFIDIINNIPNSKFDAGAKMMVELLKRRHVHPFYSGKPITPEPNDVMVIEDVPDIFVCGESHNNSYEQYRGTLCINAGTWQALTEYQIKQGHKATPCIVPVIETKYGRISVIRFDKEVEA
ncbi:MAG: DNA-directed DNA polymerase II small subunit [archaeon]